MFGAVQSGHGQPLGKREPHGDLSPGASPGTVELQRGSRSNRRLLTPNPGLGVLTGLEYLV